MTHCLVNQHITGHLVFVLASTEWIMISPATDNPASCEIHAVIDFLHAKNMTAPEINCELCAVYGQNVMSKGTVRHCCRMFRDGQTNKCSWWRTKWSAMCSEWWFCSKWNTVLLNFRTSVLISTIFTHCSLQDHHSYARLSQVLCKMGSENAHECAQNADNGFDFSEWYHKDGNEFLNYIVQVTGDETSVSFVSVETKKQSKQ
jgi:hypothetical protein